MSQRECGDGLEEPPAKKLRQDTDSGDGKAQNSELLMVGSEQGATPGRQTTTEAGGTAENQAGEGGGEEMHILESDVGITEYISDSKPVHAIIKQRYSDFIVNEVSLTGEVIHLTSTELTTDNSQSESDSQSQQQEDSGKMETDTAVDPVLSGLVQIQLKELANSKDTKLTVSIRVGDDKEERQKIHMAIKSSFPTLETKTDAQEGAKYITVMKKRAGRDGRRWNWNWPSNHRYCRFVVYKENKDTMDVISLIAKFLRVKPNVFQYAGTKDRRAKTSQEVTAFKVHPKALHNLNRTLRNIALGNFTFTEKPLKLGQLSGNRFTIVLRNVVGEEDDIEKGLTSLKNHGFINYFGMQRFGTLVPTQLVGRAMLQGKWEEAVDLILRPRPHAMQVEQFRKVWAETRDPKKTVELVHPRRHIEQTLLRTLCENPNNFLGAIAKLPRNTRMMYVHSYQSYVWNMVVSRRIRTYGLKPVVGDLVLPPQTSDACDPSEHTPQDDTAAAADAGSQEGGSSDGNSTGTEETAEPVKVKPIVLDETTVSQYTVYDVVLPLPGYAITYPNNEVHDWYTSLLEEDGFDINSMQRKQKDFSLPGAYRAMMMKATDMEWETFRYNDYTIPLALSDLDRINGEPEPVSVPDGKMQAIRLSFTLPPSSYATMALREVLKADTSAAHQTSLNTT